MRPINGDEAGKLLKKRLSQISGAVAQINLSFSSRQGEPLKIEKKAEAIASLFACVARLQKRIPIALLTNRGHDASSIYTDFLKKWELVISTDRTHTDIAGPCTSKQLSGGPKPI